MRVNVVSKQQDRQHGRSIERDMKDNDRMDNDKGQKKRQRRERDGAKGMLFAVLCLS